MKTVKSFFLAFLLLAVAVASAFGQPSTASVTRSANTTTYTVNTAWNNLTTSTPFIFPNVCAAPNHTVLIRQVDIWSSANPATKLQGVLWLFKSLPSTVIADNATFNIAAADFALLTNGSVNGIPFTLASAQAAGAANSGVTLTQLTELTSCDGSTSLWGMVQVVNAYVPASGEVLTINLWPVVQN